MLINNISVSRKKCFDTCSQQYKFRYHLKLPSAIPEPPYFSYGSIVHKVAEYYVKNQAKTPIGQIAKELLAGELEFSEEVKKCPPIPEGYEKQFLKNIKAVQKITDKIGTDGIVEYPFYFDLDPPNKRFIKGFIDRLIIKGDKAFIIDYKTTKKGKWRVNEKTVKHDLQLRIYARVAQREFGLKAENIKCALFYLEGENLIACQYSQESLEESEKDLLDAFKTIENSDPEKVWGKVGYHCANCVYHPICPFYKKSSQADTWDGTM